MHDGHISIRFQSGGNFVITQLPPCHSTTRPHDLPTKLTSQLILPPLSIADLDLRFSRLLHSALFHLCVRLRPLLTSICFRRINLQAMVRQCIVSQPHSILGIHCSLVGDYQVIRVELCHVGLEHTFSDIMSTCRIDKDNLSPKT